MAHTKHVQLGYKPTRKGANRNPLPADKHDELWASATTVDQYKADILALAAESGAPRHLVEPKPKRRRLLSWR